MLTRASASPSSTWLRASNVAHLAASALRLLYDRAEDVYHWDGPKSEYREPLTLILFDPGAKR